MDEIVQACSNTPVLGAFGAGLVAGTILGASAIAAWFASMWFSGGASKS